MIARRDMDIFINFFQLLIKRSMAQRKDIKAIMCERIIGKLLNHLIVYAPITRGTNADNAKARDTN